MARSIAAMEAELAREQANIVRIDQELCVAPQREVLGLLRTKHSVATRVLNLLREINAARAQATANMEHGLELIERRKRFGGP